LSANLKNRLEDAGYAVGIRMLELLCHREKVYDLPILCVVSSVEITFWEGKEPSEAFLHVA
jgi:hypothetical protein